MTNYVWNVSTGGVINYGSGTNQIQVSWIITGPQTVSVNYSDATGCNAATPTVFNATVNSMPNQAGPISGTANVCAGTNGVTYAVAPIPNTLTYMWTLPLDVTIVSGMGTNSITVNYGTNGLSGNINVYGNNSCGNGSVSPNFPVAVNPIPVAPVVTNTGTILYSSAPAGNQWYFEGNLIAGATSQTCDASLTGTGNYWSVVTLNGCSSDASNHLQIFTTGIDSHASSAINVYPVPNDGLFTVSIISTSLDPFTITVFSNLGIRIQEIKDIRVNVEFYQVIDLRTVLAGIYTVVIRNSSNYVVKKVVITR